MEADRDIIEFVVNVIESLTQSRCEPLDVSGASIITCNYFGIPIEEKQLIRGLYPSILSLDFETIYLDFLLTVESCHPLLIERWVFSVSPNSNMKAHTFEDVCVTLKNAMNSVNKLYIAVKYPRKVVYNLKLNKPTYTWHNDLKAEDIQSTTAFELFSENHILSVRAEYTEKHVKPDIKAQELGARPRLTSLDCIHPKDLGDLSGSEYSADAVNPIDLFIINYPLYAESDDKITLITSNCIHEHEKIGFSPLSHSICTEELDGFSDNELAIDEANDEETNPFSRSELSDDAKICLYWEKCSKNFGVNFSSEGGLTVNEIMDDIQTEMRGLREVKKYYLNKVFS